MNIFVLSKDPEEAAKFHNDKHVVKMILETAQILSSALHTRGYNSKNIYRPTHTKGPCVKWARKSRANFNWLGTLGIALAREYTHRYGKIHKSFYVISECMKHTDLIPEGKVTKFPQVMPDQYRDKDVVKAYRNYYINEKANIASWKDRSTPDWWKQIENG